VFSFFSRQKTTAGSGPSVRPKLETLEDRLTPAATNADWINGAFQALFHRNFNSSNPFDAGLLNGLNNGTLQRIDVTAEMELSVEGQTVNTNDLFQRLLLRTPQASELGFYQAFLSQGVSIQQLAGIIMSSDEFFNVIGNGTNGGFINAVYNAQLGRQAGAGDISFWDSELAGLQQFGFTAMGARQVVATAIALSPEAAVVQAGVLFTTLLDRQADPGGLAFVSSQLVGQAPSTPGGFFSIPVRPQQNVMASIVASDEFFSRS
jgi:hypothetical protein